MIVGLALALGSALVTNVAFLFKQRGALLAPPLVVTVTFAAPNAAEAAMVRVAVRP